MFVFSRCIVAMLMTKMTRRRKEMTPEISLRVGSHLSPTRKVKPSIKLQTFKHFSDSKGIIILVEDSTQLFSTFGRHQNVKHLTYDLNLYAVQKLQSIQVKFNAKLFQNRISISTILILIIISILSF